MSELHCDDVERLRLALSWMGYATPEGLEACCARQDDLVRDLIRAVLAQKKTIMDGKFVDCACGDRYPAISYGAGFIDAAGHCPNCAACLPAAEDAQGWRPITAPGQVKVGTRLHFTIGGKPYLEIAKEILFPGTDREEIIYNKRRNYYLITSMAIANQGSQKNVEFYAAPAMSQDSKGEV